MKLAAASLIVAALVLHSLPVSAQTAPAAAPPALSDKLDKSNGVIAPAPGVDPAMAKPAPATGSTEVIAPPGAPGGQTGVQPK